MALDTLNKEMLLPYIATGEYKGKSGGYGIQGPAASFIKGINGCYFSVWGLPLNKFTSLLTEMIKE